jgi:hypothetical protein
METDKVNRQENRIEKAYKLYCLYEYPFRWLVWNTYTLVMINTLVRLESAMSAVDQPVVEVDQREVRDLMSHFTIMGWSNSCHTSSFIIQNKLISINNKRGNQKGDLQYIQQ